MHGKGRVRAVKTMMLGTAATVGDDGDPHTHALV
jgi:hypothetical protein